MKLLKENFFTKEYYCYSRYDGYFEHTRENGEVMLLHIYMNTKHNSEDIDVSLFIKDYGFKCIATFFSIEGLYEINDYDKGDKFVELVGKNLNTIEEWLDIVFH
jgi:hypothetical protein